MTVVTLLSVVELQWLVVIWRGSSITRPSLDLLDPEEGPPSEALRDLGPPALSAPAFWLLCLTSEGFCTVRWFRVIGVSTLLMLLLFSCWVLFKLSDGGLVRWRCAFPQLSISSDMNPSSATPPLYNVWFNVVMVTLPFTAMHMKI